MFTLSLNKSVIETQSFISCLTVIVLNMLAKVRKC